MSFWAPGVQGVTIVNNSASQTLVLYPKMKAINIIFPIYIVIWNNQQIFIHKIFKNCKIMYII